MTYNIRPLRVRASLYLLLTILLASNSYAIEESDLRGRVDALMGHMIEELDVVPGFSIAVVTPGATVLEKGYGVTAVSDGVPMSADTQVYIASSTKSFTALAVASLAKRGLIDLDTPISNYVPTIAKSAAGQTTLRQLLSHTHGLSEEALTWRTAYSGQYTRELLLTLVENLELSETSGEFDYSNTGYVITSLVLEHRFNKPWQAIVKEEVLTPIGMNSTTAYVSALDERYARPHSWYGVKNQFPLTKQDNTMHAAGGHFSTATDMALWLQAQLGDGRVDDRQVFSPGLIASTQTPVVSLDADFYTYKRHHYGLGWYHADYRGQKMLHHFGSFAGYRAHVSFVPELGIGVAVLVNDSSRPGFNLPDLIANYIYDLAAGTDAPEQKAREEIDRIAGMIEPMVGRTPPKRPRNAPDDEARFAGSYENEKYGNISFSMSQDGLVATYGNLSSATTYKEDGSIRMELIPYRGTLGRFIDTEDGKVVSFEFRGARFDRIGTAP